MRSKTQRKSSTSDSSNSKSRRRRTTKEDADKGNAKMKGTLGRQMQLQAQRGQVSLFPLHHQHYPLSSSSTAVANNDSSHFLNRLDVEDPDSRLPPPFSSTLSTNELIDVNVDDKDFILSQDFFCTPDYITPDNQNLLNSFDYNKENALCPKSPEKLNTTKSKRCRLGSVSVNPLSPSASCHQQTVEHGRDEGNMKKSIIADKKRPRYVSYSAISLRCRVIPPPCIKNPYLRDSSENDIDPFVNQRSKCVGLAPELSGGDGLSRYHTDFHEIEQIGVGNFSTVFKVLKRIDGCFYAVKSCSRPLHQETEKQKALMEVQALAALGSHENIVGYYSSWFENELLYIQMELCDCSLSVNRTSKVFTEGEALEVLNQVAKALLFMHERGIAHLDVKPENIYVKNGVYKLGDFGCASLLDKSLVIEEGDARYMPQEILNDEYDHLDKVDVFSLGASIYELIRGSPLPESGSQFLNLREGKIPLLPGHSLLLQNLLKVMMDPDPVQRPSTKELIENPIFLRVQPKSYDSRF